MVQLLNQQEVLEYIIDKFDIRKKPSEGSRSVAHDNYIIENPDSWIQQRWGKSEG